MVYNQLASEEKINRALKALEANGIAAYFVETREAAKHKVLELIPRGAEVMNMTSMTLEAVSAVAAITESGDYDLLRSKFKGASESERRKLGGGPDWVVGSVHALTEDGKLMIASNTGSQLGAYAYGGGRVIWVVGAQKIVKDIDEGFKRIYEHSLPLEDARAQKAYGMGSNVSKILIINKEVSRGRATVIIVNRVLGF